MPSSSRPFTVQVKRASRLGEVEPLTFGAHEWVDYGWGDPASFGERDANPSQVNTGVPGLTWAYVNVDNSGRLYWMGGGRHAGLELPVHGGHIYLPVRRDGWYRVAITT